MPAFRDLVDRRVPHYLAVYLGAGWGIVEFMGFLEQRYALSAVWTDLVLLAWVLFIPSVILFSYHHGRQGKDRWVRTEKVGIPLNAGVVAVVVAIALSSRADASVTTVVLTDETGETVERAVPRSEYRKRLAIFSFDAPGSDTALAWLANGVPSLLATDLSQDIFLDMRVTAHFRERLEEAGIELGQRVPVALQRRIASDLHLPYFLSGSVTRDSSATSIRAVLHETATSDVVGDRTVTGTDVMTLVDELSVLLKTDLGLPRTQPGIVKDLPLAEVLSSSFEAVRALTEALAATLRDDWPAAERLALRATELDPTFALAQFVLYQVRSLMGDAQSALPPLNAAMQHLYRLPERIQFNVKVEHFLVQQDMEKAYAVATMMTELYPDDLQGYQLRLTLESLLDDRDAAIATLRRILELDPQQQERLIEIGRLQEASGAHDDALRTYGEYATRFPQHHGVQLRIAQAHQALGQLAAAREAVERALLIEPTDTEVLVEMASLLRASGEFDEAWQRIEGARAAARTPQDKARLYRAVQEHHAFRGQTLRAIDAAAQRLAALAEFQPPIYVVGERMSSLGTMVEAGQHARALAALDEVREQMQAQLYDFWRIGQLRVAIQTRDTLQLNEAIAGVRPIIDGLGLRTLEPTVAHGVAVLHEVRADWDGALDAYQRQQQLDPGSLAINRDIARVLRQLGRLDDALAALDRHLRAVPMSAKSNLEAARVLLERGDTARARGHIERASHTLADADAGYALLNELNKLQALARAPQQPTF